MGKINFEGADLTPSKIVCIGRNYVGHIKELENEIPTEPVIFIKPNSAIGDEINISENEEIHFEGEISFLIESGKLSGVAFGIDLTKRDIQSRLKEKGLPWERAKAFNGSAVFSKFIRLNDDINELRLELYINGRIKQSAGCQLMLYKPASLMHEINTFLKLEDGDIIMSGTPEGVGPLKTGDRLEGKILCKDKVLVSKQWFVKKVSASDRYAV